MRAEDIVKCINPRSKYYNREFYIVGFFDKDDKTYADLHYLDDSMGIDVDADLLEDNFQIIC